MAVIELAIRDIKIAFLYFILRININNTLSAKNTPISTKKRLFIKFR